MFRAVICASIIAVIALGSRPVDLRVHSLLERDATGIPLNPVFSWDLNTPISAEAANITRVEVEVRQPGSSFRWIRGREVLSSREAFAPVRMDGTEALEPSSRYQWRVCIHNNAVPQPMCSALHTFVTGLRNGDISWVGKWLGGTSSLFPSPCTRCMASYHAWCKPGEKGPTCGFQGAQLRSPDIKLPQGTVKQAVIHATGLGMFDVQLNGKPAGGGAVLEPGFSTNFTERLLYSTYDVTDLLQGQSAAVIGVKVGAGKYSLGIDPLPTWALRCELHVSVALADGTVSNTTLGTDSNWLVSASPVIYENLYKGEQYDARLEQPGWARPGFVPALAPASASASASASKQQPPQWTHAQVLSAPPVSGRLAPRLMPPMRVTQVVTPVNVSKVTLPNVSASWMFDLGQNYAGVARLRLPAGAPAGASVRLQFGEHWDYSKGVFVGTTYDQADKYIFSGKEKAGDTYTPSFVYHGARFVRVDYPVGVADQKCGAADAGCLVGLFIHSDVQKTGHLTIGSPASNTRTAKILDSIHKSVVQTQLCNLHSIPTDCPQREKRGWMGDAQWTAEEATLNLDVHALYTNWVTTMQDMQQQGCTKTSEQYSKEPPYGTCCSPTLDQKHPTIFQCSPQSNSTDTDGSIPDVVPLLWGNGGGRGWPGAPVWAAAFVVIPDLLLSRYHDLDFARRLYPSLTRYMQFLQRQATAYGGGVPQFGLLGDWCSIEPLCPGSGDSCLKTPGWTRGNPTSSFYYVLHLRTMEAIATAIGKADDARTYAALAKSAAAAYNSAFFNASAGNYGGAQTANVMPLALGIVPEGHVPSVVAALIRGLEKASARARAGAEAAGRSDGSVWTRHWSDSADVHTDTEAADAADAADAAAAGATRTAPDVALATGCVGTRWILQALSSPLVNRTDIALALASRTAAPSWGWMVTNQPGTLWENWEMGSGSSNHIMFGGGIDPWLYSEVGGIRLPSSYSALYSSLSSSLPLNSAAAQLTSGSSGDSGGISHTSSELVVVELAVKPEVIVAVGECSAAVRVPGGRLALEWRWTAVPAASSSADVAQESRLHFNASVPIGYAAKITVPPTVGEFSLLASELLLHGRPAEQEAMSHGTVVWLKPGQHALHAHYTTVHE